jgi:hypothetical protein
VLLHGPADRPGLGLRRDRAVGLDDLRDHEPRGRREAGNAGAVVSDRRDLARDEGPVAVLVVHRPADEALPRGDSAAELRVADVDPRVDHGDADREELIRSVEDVERAVAAQVPLARRQRVVRERESHRGRRRCERYGDRPGRK